MLLCLCCWVQHTTGLGRFSARVLFTGDWCLTIPIADSCINILWMKILSCRPLSEELLQYAQTDVHFLCYLAGQLCARLAAKGPDCLREASRRSHEMSLALYNKPTSEVHPIRDLIMFTSCALIGCNACSNLCMSYVQ